MRYNYMTVYGRKTFNVSNSSSVTGMTLSINYDDGFVAYINGNEVARANMPAGTPVAFDLASYTGNLVTGTNVLSIEGHNKKMRSSGFSMIPELMIVSQ